jgi:uncharacterized membrane protein YjjP (DUF1212 family)
VTVASKLRRDRKYKAFWAVFLFSCAALFFDKLNGEQWVDLVIFVFGLYMAGNVGAHFTQKDMFK